MMFPPVPADFDVVLPPAWAFGILHGNWGTQDHILRRVNELIDAEIPVDGYWIDAHFWDHTGKGPKGFIDFVGDRVGFPDPAGMWKEFERLGVRAGLWVWDRILEDGNETVFNEFAEREYFKKIERMTVEWHTDGKSRAGLVDFNNPRAAAFWKSKLAAVFELGVDFLKIDSKAALPYMKAAFEATQEFGRHTGGRGFILAHCNGDGDPATKRYPTLWSGDSKVAWGQEDYPDNVRWIQGGLREQIAMVANPAHPHYRWPFLTNDTGGYDSGTPTDELFVRWAQFSCFNPITEVFGHNHIKDSNAVMEYSPEAQGIFRRFAHWKLRLFPYIYSHALRTRLEGKKTIQGNGSHTSQFLFGDWLLIAPVCEEGSRERYVYLEPGEWIDYWTGERHRIEHGTTVRCEAPLDRLPVFIRPGAIIPIRRDAPSILAGTNDPLAVHVYPAGHSEWPLYEDDGTSNGYLEGEFARTDLVCKAWDSRLCFEIEPVLGGFTGMPEERTIEIVIHGAGEPMKADLAGDWWFDESPRTLHAKVRIDTRRGAEVRFEFHEALF